MPLTFDLINLELDPTVLAAMEKELVAGGMQEGRCFVGNAPVEKDHFGMMWFKGGDIGVFANQPLLLLKTRDGGRSAARHFLARWRVRHEERLSVFNQLESTKQITVLIR